jgi:hypothetical protein
MTQLKEIRNAWNQYEPMYFQNKEQFQLPENITKEGIWYIYGDFYDTTKSIVQELDHEHDKKTIFIARDYHIDELILTGNWPQIVIKQNIVKTRDEETNESQTRYISNKFNSFLKKANIPYITQSKIPLIKEIKQYQIKKIYENNIQEKQEFKL